MTWQQQQERKQYGENFGVYGRRKLELNKEALPTWEEGMNWFREGPCGLLFILFINHVFVWVEERALILKFRDTWVQNPETGGLGQVTSCLKPQFPHL